jgi:hypothetical protein
MKRARTEEPEDAVREEYDFSKGVRGKYAARYARGTNLVLLDPDVAKLYPTAEAVNRALRGLAEIAPKPVSKARKK